MFSLYEKQDIDSPILRSDYIRYTLPSLATLDEVISHVFPYLPRRLRTNTESLILNVTLVADTHMRKTYVCLIHFQWLCLLNKN